jgi:formate hydrogenlyase subunit 3/multisubunit Na+/H+ antiporter MnhD subunit
MNAKVKKGLIWGVIVASMILVINVFHYLFGGLNALAAGPHGHGPRGTGHHGGFAPQHMMGYHQQGFSWGCFLVFLILGMVALVFLVKWLRKKSKSNAMQQFIDTSLMSSHRSTANTSANILDQWEKNMLNKKENK